MTSPKLQCKKSGNPLMNRLTNRQGLSLRTYIWPAESPRGSVVFFHGLRSHAKFSFLNHATASAEAETSSDYPRYLTYDGSWIEAFNKAGYNFCALDLQSHGDSEGWRGTRCNVEVFDDLAADGLQFILAVSVQRKSAQGEVLPIYALGISMGGGIVARVAQLYRFILRRGKVPNRYVKESRIGYLKLPEDVLTSDLDIVEQCKLLKFRGAVMLCPNFVVSNSSSVASKGLVLKCISMASYAVPFMGIAPLKPSDSCTWIDEDRDNDETATGNFKGLLPVRLCHENLILGARVHEDLELLSDEINQKLPILVIHGLDDTTTAPEGSETFTNSLSETADDVTCWMLQNVGHHIIHEENNKEVLSSLIEWCNDRLTERFVVAGGKIDSVASTSNSSKSELSADSSLMED